MKNEQGFLEWVRLTIRHREEELSFLRKLEWDAAGAEPAGDSGEPPGDRASAVTPTPREHAKRLAMVAEVATEDPVVLAEEPEVEDPVVPAEEAEVEDPVVLAEEPEVEDPVVLAEEPEVEDPVVQSVENVLLLEQGGCWVGFPWHEVDRVALTEEIPLSMGHRYRFSLRNLLAQHGAEFGGGPSDSQGGSEPFAVLWKRDYGMSLLCCGRFGGLITVEEAISRRVEWLVRPPRVGEGKQPQLLALSDVAADESSSPPVDLLPETEGVDAASTSIDAAPVFVDADPASVDTIPAGPASRPRVLLAVPYLPVRVALSRAFRKAGWAITEEFHPAAVVNLLESGRFAAIFVDLAEPLDPILRELLDSPRFEGVSLVAIGSRFHRPHGEDFGRLADAPKLAFPFQEDEVDRVVESLDWASSPKSS